VNTEAAAPAAPAAEASVLGAVSLAQPVNEAPIRHGRRALPKPRPKFDDEPEVKETAEA
jgi:hypothetical protein